MFMSKNSGNVFEDSCVVIRKHRSCKKANKKHRLHINEGHEIYLLLEGEVSFNIEGSIYKVEPNDLLIISNKEIQRVMVNDEFAHERIYIYFDPDYINHFSSNRQYKFLKIFEELRNGSSNKISGKHVKAYNLKQHFDDMYMWSKSEKPEREIMMVSILLQLITKLNTIYEMDLESSIELDDNIKYNDKIYEVIKYISSNLDKKITLDELSEGFFIDKYYLCHLFKEITGFTLVDYINYKKILSAKEQLKSGKPIGDVWVQFGFLNYSSFYRTFRKYVGMSPSEYIETAKNKTIKLSL